MNRESTLVSRLLSFSVPLISVSNGKNYDVSSLMANVENNISSIDGEMLEEIASVMGDFVSFGKSNNLGYSPLDEKDLLFCLSAIDLLKSKEEISDFRSFYLKELKKKYFPQCLIEDLVNIKDDRVIGKYWVNGSLSTINLKDIVEYVVNQGFDIYTNIFKNRDVINYKKKLWDMNNGFIGRN
ncbi:MAG: hypothetical protein OQK82_08510 [Candidatus Pacearchaeota archaeon]|nr:hypothetical protein [Candidatus Pacearchaeota archaeon]